MVTKMITYQFDPEHSTIHTSPTGVSKSSRLTTVSVLKMYRRSFLMRRVRGMEQL